MVLYHLAGEKLYFPSHSVTLDASLVDHPDYEIYSAHDSTTRYTVKYMPFKSDSGVSRRKYAGEAATLSALPRHPRVLPLCDTLELTDRDTSVYQLFDCSLVCSLRMQVQLTRLSDSQILEIVKELCEALQFVHSLGFLHRNVSLDSVFLAQNGGWMLGEFGTSLPANYQMTDTESLREVEMMTVQTLRAPEQFELLKIRLANEKIDMWAVGCLLYELIAGTSPFSIAKKADQMRAVYTPLSDKANRKLAELVERLLVLDMTLRPSAMDILMSLQTMETRANQLVDLSKGSIIGNLLKTSTRSWIENATSVNDSMPELKYVEKLISKAWEKPFKIEKFYHFLIQRPLGATIVAIKALLLFHKYLLHGPKQVVASRKIGCDQFLAHIEEIWTSPSTIGGQDAHRCEYFNGLIRQYSKLLKAKVLIMTRFSLTGAWEGEVTLGFKELEQFISHWNRLNHFVKGLFLGVPDLPELRFGLAQLLLEEMFKAVKIIHVTLTAMLEQGQSPKLEQCIRIFTEELIRSQTNAESLFAQRPSLSHFNFQPFALAVVPSIGSDRGPQTVPEDRPAPPAKQFHSGRGATPSQSTESPPDTQSFISHTSGKGTALQVPKQLQSYHSDGEQPIIELKPPVIEPLLPQPRPEPKEQLHLDPSKFAPGEASWVIKESQLIQQEVIGGGSSCTVFKGTYKRTAVAIKVLRSVVNGEHLKEFARELSALLHLRHPNLVLFMGASFTPQLMIVTEFCAGDTLFKLLHMERSISLSWKQKLKMCMDIAHGMNYLHESEPPILHRDLKSLNLLLTDKVTGPNDSITVKITDFGVSKFLDESVNMMNTGQMGTCHWMAPEVLAGQQYSLPADVYSYGIVVWEIVCRDTPYRGLNPTLIPYRVLNCNERPSLELLPSSCPEELKTLVVRCWQTDPNVRPTFPEILDILEGIKVSGQLEAIQL